MLYVVLAYLMLFAALSNAVCLYNAFNLFVFPNSMFTPFLYERAMCSLVKYHLRITVIIIIIIRHGYTATVCARL